ncbi:hypothetical protein CsSME_00030005 [Camellia sinensis var. sinensis]
MFSRLLPLVYIRFRFIMVAVLVCLCQSGFNGFYMHVFCNTGGVCKFIGFCEIWTIPGGWSWAGKVSLSSKSFHSQNVVSSHILNINKNATKSGRGSGAATESLIRYPSARLADWRKSIRIRPPIRRMWIERIGSLVDGCKSVCRFKIL